MLRNHSKCNSPIIRYRYLDHHHFYYYYYYYHYHYHDHYYYYHYYYYFSPEGAYLSQAHLRVNEGEPSRGLRVLLFSPLYIVRIFK